MIQPGKIKVAFPEGEEDKARQKEKVIIQHDFLSSFLSCLYTKLHNISQFESPNKHKS
jgi:hypothetical protein